MSITKKSSFSLRPLIFLIGIIPGYILCMTLGLVGYGKLSGKLAAKFYV